MGRLGYLATSSSWGYPNIGKERTETTQNKRAIFELNKCLFILPSINVIFSKIWFEPRIGLSFPLHNSPANKRLKPGMGSRTWRFSECSIGLQGKKQGWVLQTPILGGILHYVITPVTFFWDWGQACKHAFSSGPIFYFFTFTHALYLTRLESWSLTKLCRASS